MMWPGLAAAQAGSDELSAELFTGSAWSLPLPIVVQLHGERTRFTARYSTRPFANAPYYSYRVGEARGNRAIELEMLHHKLYLENPRPPVESFEITHGFNQPMINVATPLQRWHWRLGLGVVVAHPEGRIGGQSVGAPRTLFGGGYQIAGVSTQVAFGRRYLVGSGATAMTAAVESKLTAALARVRISGGGSVLVPNVAVHALGGVGVRRRE